LRIRQPTDPKPGAAADWTFPPQFDTGLQSLLHLLGLDTTALLRLLFSQTFGFRLLTFGFRLLPIRLALTRRAAAGPYALPKRQFFAAVLAGLHAPLKC